MEELPRLDVPEHHEHFWLPIKRLSAQSAKVRCLRCGLEALQVKGRIYRTLKQLEMNLQAGE